MSWRFWWEHPARLRLVVVNLKDSDTAILGVLWQQAGPWIVLKEAYVLTGGREPVKADGEIVVEKANVSFYQVLP
jgi:hypothetical protein